MFANDVAGCAGNAIKLQHKNKYIIDIFCCDTWMAVNMDKTEITVFRNGGPLCRYEYWSYRGTQINITSEYKYIGILLPLCLPWSYAHSKL
jgi:hypothetical protein